MCSPMKAPWDPQGAHSNQLAGSVAVSLLSPRDLTQILTDPQIVACACSVSYMHVAEKKGCFSMGVFLFKDGANLPLHDHPSMSVYSRCASASVLTSVPAHLQDSRPSVVRTHPELYITVLSIATS